MVREDVDTQEPEHAFLGVCDVELKIPWSPDPESGCDGVYESHGASGTSRIEAMR
jgi:hypothetical protein